MYNDVVITFPGLVFTITSSEFTECEGNVVEKLDEN